MAGEELGQGYQGRAPDLGPPPGPDESMLGRLLGPVIPFFVIAVFLASLRLYTRLTRRKGIDFSFAFSWDDVTLLLALMFTVFHFSLLMAAVPHGVGRHNYYVPYEEQVEANMLLLFSQLPWGWSVAFAKISIACLLLRLKSPTSEGLWPWKVPLYFLILVQIACAVTANIVQLTQCRPIRAIWNPTIPGAQCQDPWIAHLAIYITGVLAIMSDIFLATAPISFLKNVRRSVRERAILIFLMGLAAFTAVATVVKLPMVEPYGKHGDALSDTIGIMEWSSIEAYMGIIAASVPCLKSPFEGFLRRVGVLKSTASNGSDHGSYGGSWHSHNLNHGHHDSHGYGHQHPHTYTHVHNHDHPYKQAHIHNHTNHDRRGSLRLSNILLPAVKVTGGNFLSPKWTPDVILTPPPQGGSSEQSISDHSSFNSKKEAV
ncbi:hypothetical protein V8F33_006681 [Rhypophila sp. PSN 637]